MLMAEDFPVQKLPENAMVYNVPSEVIIQSTTTTAATATTSVNMEKGK